MLREGSRARRQAQLSSRRQPCLQFTSTSLQPSTYCSTGSAWQPSRASLSMNENIKVLDYFLESDVVFSVSPIFGSLHIQLAIARYTRFEFSNFEFCVQRTKFAPLLRHASSIAAPTLRVIRTLSHQQFLPACQRTASEKHRTNVPRRPHQLPPFLSLQTTCILSRQRVLPRNRPTASVKSPPRLPRPPHQSWLSRLRVSINEVLQKLNSLSASELVEAVLVFAQVVLDFLRGRRLGCGRRRGGGRVHLY